MRLKSPYPYFGGKGTVASLIWDRFGDVPNYVEPFFGSGAVLLQRPHRPRTETVNDLNAFICNFWRAVKSDPAAVVEHADFPVNENQLHSVQRWLVRTAIDGRLQDKLDADPDFFDPLIAGRWVWGACLWIGRGWCAEGIRWKQRPELGNAGRGINAGRASDIRSYVESLAKRMRSVRVCCGDWLRVVSPCVTTEHGRTAVFLDPPYDNGERDDGLYTHDDGSVAATVREWAIANGDNPDLRICLAGYEGEHSMPEAWECVSWKTAGGFALPRRIGENTNIHRERLWFSPACINPARDRMPLFADVVDEPGLDGFELTGEV